MGYTHLRVLWKCSDVDDSDPSLWNLTDIPVLCVSPTVGEVSEAREDMHMIHIYGYTYTGTHIWVHIYEYTCMSTHI